MSSALQNRLVGTVIVVAIAVIFLPDLLDGKTESKRDLFVELPEKPVMKKVELPANFDIEKVKEAATRKVEVVSEQALDEQLLGSTPEDSAETSSESADVKVADPHEELVSSEPEAKNDTSSLQSQTVVEQDTDRLLASAGWVVQLGSFRNKNNVKDLIKVLDNAGYRAFSRPVKTNSGTLTKVFVGPDLQKEKLEDALSHLKELTRLQGRVTPFTVQ